MMKSTRAAHPDLARATARAGGFTLVELVITLAILAIVMSIAVPAFNELLLGNRLASFANSLANSATLARSEAIKRNAAVTLCVSSSGDGDACGTGSWDQGWIVLSGADVLHRQAALPSGLIVSETAATDSIVFRPTGVGATPASFTVCQNSPSVGSQERVVAISATGRPSVDKTTAGSCP